MISQKHKYSKTIITPYRHPLHIPWGELWQYRELLWMLAYRDFRIRYAQTTIGIAWGILQPLLSLLILSFVFGTIAKMPTNGSPHLVYTLTGLTAWTYISQVISEASNAIINAQNMIQKIYFPRIALPLSKALTALVDLLIVLLLLVILLWFYQVPLSPHWYFLPIFILLSICCGLAGGIWLSALTIRFRDFRFITPLLLRLGMFATPIAYSTTAVPADYQTLFYLNPVAGIVDGFRWCILGEMPPSSWAWLSFGLLFFLLITGLVYFNHVEREIADIL